MRSSRLRSAIAALALLALLGRALIPVGFMPVASHGATHLMFCHGGAAHAPAAGQGRTRHGAEAPCSYALSGGPALLAELTLPPLAALPDAQPEVAALPGPRASAPPRHAAPRGPPTLI